jgi:Ni/Fe-hydrogenase subunit HybB-like protein
MSNAVADIDRAPNNRWERNVPVYGFPVVNGFFLALSALVLVAFILSGYRELAGLGPVSGMNDAYGWGIWKTFNLMVLTALGSGAFAVGIAAWVFRRKRLHSLMRMALLTSFLAYACGLLLLGIDAGRPWNFYWIVFPWRWNMHSPLAEVAICMSIYAMIPLAVENIPPVLERLWYFDSRLRPGVESIEKRLHAFFPWIIAAAYLLPGMHQSSLGAGASAVADAVAARTLPRSSDVHVIRLRGRDHDAVLSGLEAGDGHGSPRRGRPHHLVADFWMDGAASARHPVTRGNRDRVSLRPLRGRVLA